MREFGFVIFAFIAALSWLFRAELPLVSIQGPEAEARALAGSEASAKVKGPCGDDFALASEQDRRSFLTQASGVWRDELGPARASKSKSDLAEHEGLIIDAKRISLARVHVRAQLAKDLDALVAVGPEDVVLASEAAIGQVDRDGFRPIEGLFKNEKGETYCLRYAMKTSRSLDDRDLLFVKGPEQKGGGAKPPAGFSVHDKNSIRAFVR